MSQQNAYPLTMIPSLLSAFDGPRPRYPAVYRAVVDAEIPATNIRGRWFIATTDLPAVAAHFGMSPKAR